MNRLAVFVVENLVLRVGDLETDRTARLDEAIEHDVLAAHQDVFEERLVQPRGANRSAAVVDRRFENLESRPPRRSEAADQHSARYRRRLT
jgi:hypothetical protein